MLFRYQPSSVAQLIDGDTFQFYIRANSLTAHFSSYPVQYAEINSALDAVGSPPYQLPVGQWVTLGFMHDGFGTIELSANGQVIARRTGVFAPIDAPGPAGINIGNDRNLEFPVERANRRRADLASQSASLRSRFLRTTDGRRDRRMLEVLPGGNRRRAEAPS